MLRVQAEAFQAANVALGQMKAAALPAPSADMGLPVAASIPSTPEAIGAGRDATPPHLQVGPVCVGGALSHEEPIHLAIGAYASPVAQTGADIAAHRARGGALPLYMIRMHPQRDAYLHHAQRTMHLHVHTPGAPGALLAAG